MYVNVCGTLTILWRSGDILNTYCLQGITCESHVKNIHFKSKTTFHMWNLTWNKILQNCTWKLYNWVLSVRETTCIVLAQEICSLKMRYKWHSSVPFVVLYFWPRFWSKVMHYIKNRVLFGTQSELRPVSCCTDRRKELFPANYYMTDWMNPETVYMKDLITNQLSGLHQWGQEK